MRLRCLIGLHSWRIASETSVEGTGFTDIPMEYEAGGIDYQIRCAHCPSSHVISKRGVWVPPKYPPLHGAK